MKIYVYFVNIFLCSLPWTPSRPCPRTDFPSIVDILHLSDIHTGQPEAISKRIIPSDHTSKLHGADFLFRVKAYAILVLVCICDLVSKNSRISGARYSGVVAVIYVTLWNSKAEPKSMSLIFLISVLVSFISTRILSGFKSE